ncbi:MAG: DNA-protecting protein DprA [Alphaproteobacteria bacterium]|nr:DNA-protecting protein DprA [Alphaproteobacteria bacterium]MBT5827894.1 DNA-protecting protein DprA [Alphaproteobacteria bacterium]
MHKKLHYFDLIKLSYLPNKAINKLRHLCIKALDLNEFLSLPTVENELAKIAHGVIEQDYNFIIANDIEIITFFSPSYPKYFKNISHFPIMFYAKGNLDLLQGNLLAIVGSRSPNLNNIKLVEDLCDYLNHFNLVLISGMAKGIDSVVHLNAKNTIAVIGTGLKQCYPRENKYLMDRLSDEQLIISEYPINMAPMKMNFPKRNRIIAALAELVIIIEAKINSGSISTANFALSYNKDIFAVAGHPYDYKVMGTNKLIKDGANMLLDFAEVIEVLNQKIKVERFFNEVEPSIKKNIKINKVVKTHKEVLNYVAADGVEFEDLISKLNMDTAELNEILAELELEDFIYQDEFGKIYKRVN